MRVLHLSGSFLALTPLLAAGVAWGQTTSRYSVPAVGVAAVLNQYPTPAPMTVQPLSDADLLASEIRLLAADPNNLQSLVRAGELALKLDDDTAAAAFFVRAERIDPHNGRVKAGQASLLIAAERPGEALRRFAEAQAYGATLSSFAADRGLAYDLIGEQDRAQRDYRVALRAGPNDETQRRYALSLGISGKRELALAEIEPLLRKSDRGAWRSRAFILAMSGDKAGAEKIATSMMPAGMAQGLQPFFEILPGLRPADRAFAVHFGEVRATPERAFDARLVPPLAALPPDPTAPVELAAVLAKPVAVADARKERKSRRKRDQVAAVTTPPPEPLPAPPLYAGQSAAPPVVLASNSVRVPSAYAPVVVRPVLVPTPKSNVVSVPQSAVAAPVVRQAPPVPPPSPVARPPIVLATPPVILPVVKPAIVPAPSLSSVAPAVGSVPAVDLQSSPAPAITAVESTASPPATEQGVGPAPATVVALAPPVVAPATVVAPTPTPVRSEESILASIIADIKVPGAERQPEPTIVKVAPPRPIEAAPPAQIQPPVDQAEIERKASEKKAADKKALADKKAAADKKVAETKKIADAKKAAEEKRRNDPKVLEPSRVWVQVSGGANEHDLPKQWAKVRAQSKAFGSKGGWTTPLRATNRVLTGPFKTESEAQSFVNTIAKDGLSGFVFVSEAGQKIVRLGAK